MKFSVATTIAFASLAYAEAPAPAVTQAPTEPKLLPEPFLELPVSMVSVIHFMMPSQNVLKLV